VVTATSGYTIESHAEADAAVLLANFGGVL